MKVLKIFGPSVAMSKNKDGKAKYGGNTQYCRAHFNAAQHRFWRARRRGKYLQHPRYKLDAKRERLAAKKWAALFSKSLSFAGHGFENSAAHFFARPPTNI